MKALIDRLGGKDNFRLTMCCEELFCEGLYKIGFVRWEEKCVIEVLNPYKVFLYPLTLEITKGRNVKVSVTAYSLRGLDSIFKVYFDSSPFILGDLC